jgi:L-aminopeptidase/D-esterase-like protein
LDGWETGDALIDGICLTGGSCCGIEAIGGATTSMFSERADGHVWNRLARVMGAVIYDYRPRDNSIYPDRNLGAFAATNALSGEFHLGRKGAGCSATAGKGLDYALWEFSGQGGAFAKRSNFSVGVFTVVNSVGAIIDKSGRTIRGHIDPKTGKRLSYEEVLDLQSEKRSSNEGGNTTLSVLVTDLKLTPYELRQLTRSVHSSMSKAIYPFHALADGDVLFGVSTQLIDPSTSSYFELLDTGCELAYQAVHNCFDPE